MGGQRNGRAREWEGHSVFIPLPIYSLALFRVGVLLPWRSTSLFRSHLDSLLSPLSPGASPCGLDPTLRSFQSRSTRACRIIFDLANAFCSVRLPTVRVLSAIPPRAVGIAVAGPLVPG